MRHAELVMRRKNVAREVAEDPIELNILRPLPPVKNENTGGMVKQPDQVLPRQTARILQNVRRFTSGVEHAEAGDIPSSEYRLLATHNTDIKPNDKFMWLGEWYRVMPHGIHTARQESIFAAIELLGPANRD